MKTLIILSPSPNESGPSKGAIALANLLSDDFNIIICFTKKSKGDITNELEKNIDIYYGLSESIKILLKSRFIRNYETYNSSVISYCIVQDLLNFLFFKKINRIYSFRANHKAIYLGIYGKFGIALAKLHDYFGITASKILVMSYELKNILPHRTKKKSHVIKNFISPKINFPQWNYDKNQEYVAVVVSRLADGKNIHQAIDLVSRLDIFSRIEVFGEGPLKSELESYADKKGIDCKFKGFIKKPYLHFPQNAILLHPSSADGFPRSVLEGMASSMPIIINNLLGAKEYISNYSFGIVVRSFKDEEIINTFVKNIPQKKENAYLSNLDIIRQEYINIINS